MSEDQAQTGGNTMAGAMPTDALKANSSVDVSADSDVLKPGGVSEENVATINRELQEKSVLRHAGDLNMPYVNIGKTPLNPDFFNLIDIETAKKAKAVSFFKVGKKVRVAVVDPEMPETKEVIESLRSQGFEVDVNLASEPGVDEAIKTYDSSQKYKKPEIVETVAEKTIDTYEKEIANLSDLAEKLNTVTAEEGLNLLNVGAMKTNASDIHYEPEENTVNVRFRIDGMLHKVFEIKPETFAQISNQIKYEGKMQLNVENVPQDGRYTFTFNEKIVAVRVSSIPTPFGESFVCRFLVSGETTLTLEALGFQGAALNRLTTATKISQGMILVTGPTGSGKSTTLYSLLNMMNSPENKLITLEDPVEYHLSGVTQSQIDEKHDYTFVEGLRTVLRQDPDVVMLGEIRDLETAETAAQAALTGHVLLSTLHTNSAIDTIPRLVNMGLPPFMVAPALDTIVAQRLARRVCPHCSTKKKISDSETKEFDETFKNLENVNKAVDTAIPQEVPKTHGCDICSNTGYKGRLVLTEVVTITAEMKELILNNASSVKLILAARKDGMITIREDGLMKVSQGLTTLEEVHRVTNISRFGS